MIYSQKFNKINTTLAVRQGQKAMGLIYYNFIVNKKIASLPSYMYEYIIQFRKMEIYE